MIVDRQCNNAELFKQIQELVKVTKLCLCKSKNAEPLSFPYILNVLLILIIFLITFDLQIPLESKFYYHPQRLNNNLLHQKMEHKVVIVEFSSGFSLKEFAQWASLLRVYIKMVKGICVGVHWTDNVHKQPVL
jgi:uncharacterized protein (DUF983 family)